MKLIFIQYWSNTRALFFQNFKSVSHSLQSFLFNTRIAVAQTTDGVHHVCMNITDYGNIRSYDTDKQTVFIVDWYSICLIRSVSATDTDLACWIGASLLFYLSIPLQSIFSIILWILCLINCFLCKMSKKGLRKVFYKFQRWHSYCFSPYHLSKTLYF